MSNIKEYLEGLKAKIPVKPKPAVEEEKEEVADKPKRRGRPKKS